MAERINTDPKPADYDDRTTAAVRAVLLEIGQILGSYHGKFVVIGGTVPWLLLDNEDMRHIGSFDVDLSLDPVALAGGEYAMLVDELKRHDYQQSDDLKKFQMVRAVPVEEGPPIRIVVDFLMPRDAKIEKNDPPLVGNFAVQKADGAALALRWFETIKIEGRMPQGEHNRVELAVASIPALLAMKGFALKNRMKTKDAYDVYYCIRNYPGGPVALATQCRQILESPEAVKGFKHIAEKFERQDGVGPAWVRRFAEDAGILDGRTPDQWEQDALGQVSAWAKALNLESKMK
ncbi:hypothetical protein [Inquilinus sp. CA228]|uniref:hypothetical protein n=1 Tax=Inquilinus sp. CA228 TaxID=3455609 RepID=UPI003F8CFA7B